VTGSVPYELPQVVQADAAQPGGLQRGVVAAAERVVG
jgi:hypothetical protein